MAELLFVTGNEKKLQEARQILSPHGIDIVGAPFSMVEVQLDSPQEVVLHKARKAFEHFQRRLIVDDTALFFDGYPSFPGSYTKAMVRTLGATGLNKLFEENQEARFVSYVCLFDGEAHLFEGTWLGKLVKGKLLEGHWPYNSMFVPQGKERVLAEIPWAERVKESHRFHALSKLCKHLEEENDNS